MKISLADKKSSVQLVVDFITTDKSIARLPKSNQNILQRAIKEKRFKKEAGQCFSISTAKSPDFIIFAAGDAITKESLRQLGGKITGLIKSGSYGSVQLNISALVSDKISENDVVGSLSEGCLLADYEFTKFKTKKTESKNISININAAKNKANAEALKTSEILAEATNFSKFLGDCPGNYLTPTQLAKEATEFCGSAGVKVTAWNKTQIAKEKMDSLLGVSLGSSEEPRFIIMEHKGGTAKDQPICLVGKGLTFDSGGISLKPGAGMEEMKYDMCGGAAVIGAMYAISKLKLPINVIGLVPASENMPGPAANKPGDIRAARNGVTIEINNTDAEGRLILADALVYASEQKPKAIFDTATLTGAMMIALGNTHTGFFTRNDELAKRIEIAAEGSGERVWHMPLVDDHCKDMKGTYADLTNLAPSKNAGSSTATAFLESFVDKNIPWAHFDIAGTAWHVGSRLSYAPKKGASGVMVRTFVELAKSYQST